MLAFITVFGFPLQEWCNRACSKACSNSIPGRISTSNSSSSTNNNNNNSRALVRVSRHNSPANSCRRASTAYWAAATECSKAQAVDRPGIFPLSSSNRDNIPEFVSKWHSKTGQGMVEWWVCNKWEIFHQVNSRNIPSNSWRRSKTSPCSCRCSSEWTRHVRLRSSDWLIDCPWIDWSIDWLIDWLFVYCSMDWLIDWLSLLNDPRFFPIVRDGNMGQQNLPAGTMGNASQMPAGSMNNEMSQRMMAQDMAMRTANAMRAQAMVARTQPVRYFSFHFLIYSLLLFIHSLFPYYFLIFF